MASRASVAVKHLLTLPSDSALYVRPGAMSMNPRAVGSILLTFQPLNAVLLFFDRAKREDEEASRDTAAHEAESVLVIICRS